MVQSSIRPDHPSDRRGARSAGVWLCDTSAIDPGLIDLLSDEERTRAARFFSEVHRQRFVAAHALLRLVLSRILKVEPSRIVFDLLPGGKPFLRNTGLEFSLSHSGHLVAIAVASEPVGIDIEKVEPRGGLDDLATRYFNEPEVAWLRRQANPTHAFFRLWTAKESAMKADGAGLRIELRDAAIDVGSLDAGTHLMCRLPSSTWIVSEIDGEGRFCAAVSRRLAVPLSVRWIDGSHAMESLARNDSAL